MAPPAAIARRTLRYVQHRSILPVWSTQSWERVNANMHRANSWHRTTLTAKHATHNDPDLVIFGPYWITPRQWLKRL